jgi:hypothetical protein
MDCWTAYYYGEHISDDDLSTMIKETEAVVKYFERRRLNGSLVIKTLRMELESLRGMVSNRAFSKSLESLPTCDLTT